MLELNTHYRRVNKNSLRPQTRAATLSSSCPQRCTRAATLSSLNNVFVQLQQKLIHNVGVANASFQWCEGSAQLH